MNVAPERDERLQWLRRIDLNLLLVFDALMKTRSATGAAKALHKTQPAVSRDLAKLRRRLGDPLLVLTKSGFIPTERALDLHAVIRDSLSRIEAAMAPPVAFDPARLEGTVNIGSGGHIEMLLAAPLLARLRKEAPGLLVRFQSIHGNVDADDIDAERIDLAIGLFDDVARRFHRKTLFKDRRVCVVAATHPLASRDCLTLDELGDVEWFAFANMYGRDTIFDKALRPLHRRMTFSAYLSGFGVTPQVLLGTHLATTMPSCIARIHQRSFELVTLEMPDPLKDIEFSMVWNQRQHSSPFHVWMRGQVTQVLETALVGDIDAEAGEAEATSRFGRCS